MKIIKENINPKWTIIKTDLIGNSYINKFHWHPRIELCYVINGEIDFTVNGKKFLAKSGDLVFFKSGAIHCYAPKSDEISVYICTFDSTIFSTDHLKMLQPFITCHELKNNNIYNEIINLFNEILAEWQEQKKGFDIICQTQITKLYFLLLRFYEDTSTQSNCDTNKFEVLQEVLDYINENYSNDITLNDIAKIANYTPNTISKLFKEYTNIGFKKYLDTLRIEKAKKLLKDNTLSITQIALQCGFNNIRSFNNVFKSITQKTPTEARNINS